jgi:hypothetical protein
MAGRLIFLLGAGASKDAGLPLMADLTTGFLPWLTGQKRVEELPLRQLFEAAVGVVSPTAGPPNIEFVLQLLSDLTVFKVSAHAQTVANWKPEFNAPHDVVSGLSGLIREYIRETLSNAPGDSGDYLAGLLDFRGEQPVDVFTLNYDRLVESMAARFEIRFTTGFGEAWDPLLFDMEGWDLRLYKLHGSVDWYRLASRNVVYRGSPEHPAFPAEAAQDVLLYPARGKAAHADPFATLMSIFNRALGTAEVCVAIGYSFRDAHIRRVVLDRMATNRSLQLLVVNPHAEEVLALKPDEDDEPRFSQFSDRVAGLWNGGKEALENRAVRHRLREIRRADEQHSYVTQYRNERQFDQAAAELYTVIEYCRTHDLPGKALGIMEQPMGGEFGKAVGSQIRRQLDGLGFSGTPFETSQTNHVVAQAGRLIALWALAVALAPGEADAVRDELIRVMRQYASSVVFLDDGQYRIWTGPLHLADEALLKKRAADLTELSSTLSYHGLQTGLALADGLTRERYEALLIGIQILAGYYRTLAQYAPTRKQVGRQEFIAPDTGGWQGIVSHVSAPFLRSKFPGAWLPPPSLQGLQSQLDGL